MKYTEYQVMWRFSEDHSPSGWTPMGQPTQELNTLIEIFLSEPAKKIIKERGRLEWEETNPFDPTRMVTFKIVQRPVTIGEWHDFAGPMPAPLLQARAERH